MTLLELIKKYADDSGSSEPDRKYSALLFALQLPGIYGRLENPVCEENKECKEDSKESKQYKLYDKNGKAKDKVIYKYWFMRHAHDFLPWCYGATSVSTLSEWIYDLRCSLTHEGKIINSEMKVFFADSDCILADQDYIIISIKTFCHKMFSFAEQLPSIQTINITAFEELEMNAITFKNLRTELSKKYKAFWNNHTTEEQSLNMVYNLITSVNPDVLNKIDDFFKTHPNSIYEIIDFDRKYSLVLPDNRLFFNERRKESAGYQHGFDSLIFKLNQKQFAIMKSIHQELDNYCKVDIEDVAYIRNHFML